jgi:hypothetical protein
MSGIEWKAVKRIFIKKKDKMGTPLTLSPSNPAVFKALFTHPNTKDSLKDIIQSFTGLSLKSAKPKDDPSLRLKVDCITTENKSVYVEMEMLPENRKKPLSEFMLDLAETYCQSNKKIYQIFFCKFILFENNKDYINRFNLRDEPFSDDATICFVELEKLGN